MPPGWRAGEGSSLRPRPCASPPSMACWLVAEIDSGINAALALLSPPSSQLQDLALHAGLAGQLEVSSLRHSPACVQGWRSGCASLLLSPS